MSTQELQELVRDFRNTLAELKRMGCEAAADAPCAPAVELGESVTPPPPAAVEGPAHLVGRGSSAAHLMFIGHAQEGDEVAAQALLEKMIVAMGWTAESVYIASLQRACAPLAGVRDEVKARLAAIATQVERVSPSVLVALGEDAAQLLLQSNESLGELRGTWQSAMGIPVMTTFDPSHLLREPSAKREAWADLQEVMRRLDELGAGPPRGDA